MRALLKTKVETKPQELSRDQWNYLKGGFDNVNGHLPLFDDEGNWIDSETIDTCQKEGWAVPVYEKNILRDLKRLRLTEEGREMIMVSTVV